MIATDLLAERSLLTSATYRFPVVDENEAVASTVEVPPVTPSFRSPFENWVPKSWIT